MPLLDQSPEVTGTRIRKQVQRLSVNSPAATESPSRRKNEFLPGRGIKLGTSPKIAAQLQVNNISFLFEQGHLLTIILSFTTRL